MPALNLPGLSTPALPASAASSPSIGARDFGSSGTEPTAGTDGAQAADAPGASFGQHLRHARGKASSASRGSDTEREGATRSAGAAARRASGTATSDTGSGAWPSTIQTASMAGGRWTGRGALAGSQAESQDPRAAALLESALQKTAVKDGGTGDARPAMSDCSATPSTLDLKSIVDLLAAAEGEAAWPPAEQPDAASEANITLSTATVEATPAARTGPAELISTTSTDADSIIGSAGDPDDALLADASATDDTRDPLAAPDVHLALSANTIASAKGKAPDDKATAPVATDDTTTSLLSLTGDNAEPADEEEKKVDATDALADPDVQPVLPVEAALVMAPPPAPATTSADTPNATPTATSPLEAAALDTRPDAVSPTPTLQDSRRDMTDAQTLAAMTDAAKPSELAAKRAAELDDESDQPQQPTDEPAATAGGPAASTAPTTAAVAPSHNAQPSPASAAALPAAQAAQAVQANAQPDASLTRVQDIATATPQASVTPVYDGTIDPAIDTAAFAPALGARIAVLARDGVEQARLNVHPADMGPISVQLSLDGTQVRVDFSADMAGTRQTLEEAMPSLAASLRDAGFTLSGGGVSQQSAQSGGSSDGNSASSNAGSAALSGTATDDTSNTGVNTTPSRSGREAGLVDVFA